MSIESVIAASTLFGSLSQSDRDMVAQAAVVRTYPESAILFRQGDEISELSLLETGSVRLTMGARMLDNDTTLTSIVSVEAPGDAFGWSALVDPHVATMTAESLDPCRVVCIDGARLAALMEQDTGMGYRVMRALSSLVASRIKSVSLRLMYDAP